MYNFLLPRKDNTTFVYNAIKDWNILLDNIKTLKTVTMSKNFN